MRAAVALVVGIVACGPVHLGDEADEHVPGEPLDSGTQQADLDSALPVPAVSVTVRASGGCEACFDLLAVGSGGRAPYLFEWQDGLREAARTLCPGQLDAPLSVVAIDAAGSRSVPHALALQSSDASCPPPAPLLCLQNPSFEGTPAANLGSPSMFDAPPWSDCYPSMTNIPDVINDTVSQMITNVPKPTDGLTYLGLPENNQASQRLCRSQSGGSTVSLQLDVGRLPVSAGVYPETELAFLEIWGGVATDCSARELLWASPSLSNSWQSFCVTLHPQQFMDNLVLRAKSDNSLLSTIVVIVDHLVPVSHCP